MRQFLLGIGCGVVVSAALAGGIAWSQNLGGPYPLVQSANIGIPDGRTVGVICVDRSNMYDRSRVIHVWRENAQSADINVSCRLR